MNFYRQLQRKMYNPQLSYIIYISTKSMMKTIQFGIFPQYRYAFLQYLYVHSQVQGLLLFNCKLTITFQIYSLEQVECYSVISVIIILFDRSSS